MRGGRAVAVAIVGCALSACAPETVDATATSSRSSTVTTSAEASDPQAVGGKIQKFYRTYLDDHTRPREYWVQSGYITPVAADALGQHSGADLVTCSQNPLKYSGYTFSTPKIDGDTGTMWVRGNYDYMSIEIDLGLVKTDGSWKINSFECVV